jgi:hypothetical protein
MKKQIIAVAAALAFTALAPAPSHAQHSMQVNIPFGFEVGNTRMPAGEYQVDRSGLDNESVEQIRRTDSSASTFILINHADSVARDFDQKLIFHCYGHECFLYAVWNGDGRSSKMTESRREKELSQIKPENELAVVSLPLTVKP